MREKIANYIYDETIPFIFLGMDHIISIIIFLILSLAIPYLAKKYLNEKQQHILGSIIGVNSNTCCNYARHNSGLSPLPFYTLLANAPYDDNWNYLCNLRL